MYLVTMDFSRALKVPKLDDVPSRGCAPSVIFRCPICGSAESAMGYPNGQEAGGRPFWILVPDIHRILSVYGVNG